MGVRPALVGDEKTENGKNGGGVMKRAGESMLRHHIGCVVADGVGCAVGGDD